MGDFKMTSERKNKIIWKKRDQKEESKIPEGYATIVLMQVNPLNN